LKVTAFSLDLFVNLCFVPAGIRIKSCFFIVPVLPSTSATTSSFQHDQHLLALFVRFGFFPAALPRFESHYGGLSLLARLQHGKPLIRVGNVLDLHLPSRGKGTREQNSCNECRFEREEGRDIKPTASGLAMEQKYGRERRSRLLLPGALLVAISAQLLAAFMLVDFRFSTLFQ